MRGFELIEELHTHFKVRGTAGHEPMVRDRTTGTVFKIVGVTTEHHGEGEPGFPETHWIEVEEF